jgi:hypothetical protein
MSPGAPPAARIERAISVGPVVDVVLGVADHGRLAGGAAGGVQAGHLLARHGEHAEGVVVAQVLLGGEGELARSASVFRSSGARPDFAVDAIALAAEQGDGLAVGTAHGDVVNAGAARLRLLDGFGFQRFAFLGRGRGSRCCRPRQRCSCCSCCRRRRRRCRPG